MIIKTREYVACKNHGARSKVKVTVSTKKISVQSSCPTHNFNMRGGFENYFAKMMMTTRRCVAYKNHFEGQRSRPQLALKFLAF